MGMVLCYFAHYYAILLSSKSFCMVTLFVVTAPIFQHTKNEKKKTKQKNKQTNKPKTKTSFLRHVIWETTNNEALSLL